MLSMAESNILRNFVHQIIHSTSTADSDTLPQTNTISKQLWMTLKIHLCILLTELASKIRKTSC